MTVTLNNRRDFTLENLKRVAINGESIRISRSAKRSMTKARQSFMAYLNSDRSRFIYGTTSGAGHHASQRLSPIQQKEMAERCGADLVVGSEPGELEAAAPSLTNGLGADVTVETVGGNSIAPL